MNEMETAKGNSKAISLLWVPMELGPNGGLLCNVELL